MARFGCAPDDFSSSGIFAQPGAVPAGESGKEIAGDIFNFNCGGLCG